MIDRIQRMVQAALPETSVVDAKPLVGGIACITTRVEVSLPDHSHRKLVVREIADYCFKLDPNFARLQFELLTELRGFGLKTPEPFGFGEACEDAPTGYVVVGFIEGEVEFSAASGRPLGSAYAHEMAAIHSVMPQCSDRLQRQNFGPFRIVEPKSEIEARVQDALQSLNIEPSGPLVLVHGDLWPGNVIWSGNDVVGVIDWDNAILGDRLYDLACTSLDLRIVAGDGVAKEFIETYRELTLADLSQLPVWDLRACMRLLRGLDDWPSVYPDMGRPDLTRQVLFQILEGFVIKTLAVLYLQSIVHWKNED